MYNLFDDNKGISLVALVITIIVVIIISTTAILYANGQDGIISRAQMAVSRHNAAQELENEIMKRMNNKMLNETTNEIGRIVESDVNIEYKLLGIEADKLKIELSFKSDNTLEGLAVKCKDRIITGNTINAKEYTCTFLLDSFEDIDIKVYTDKGIMTNKKLVIADSNVIEDVIGNEGATINLPEGIYLVAFGKNNQWKYKWVENKVTFSNTTFGGDPAPLTPKKGYVLKHIEIVEE